mgnify:CR=1 FL=1|jgi:serine/threonine protein kinase
MAFFADDFGEELTQETVLKQGVDHIRVMEKDSAMKTVTRGGVNRQERVVFSDLVILIDPTLRFKRRKQFILVLTRNVLHLLLPVHPFTPCPTRLTEIPISWVTKLFVDRIGSHILLKIPADFDMFLEVPAKSQFLHLFSQLHHLQLMENRAGKRTGLVVEFAFQLEKLEASAYVDKKLALKTKSYKDARERINLLLKEAKKDKTNQKKRVPPKRVRKKTPKEEKTALTIFGRKGEEEKASLKTSDTKKNAKERRKSVDDINIALGASDGEIQLVGRDKVMFIKAIKQAADTYSNRKRGKFGTFAEKVFHNLEFNHGHRVELPKLQDSFFPSVFCKATGISYSVRKVEVPQGTVNNEQRALTDLKGKEGIMELFGTFEETENVTPGGDSGGFNPFKKRAETVSTRFKYYVMAEVHKNFADLIKASPAKHGLPLEDAAQWMYNLLCLIDACHQGRYYLGGISLSDLYIKEGTSKRDPPMFQYYNVYKYSTMHAQELRKLHFADVCTCSKEYLGQAFQSHLTEELRTDPYMDFWTFGIILFKALTGKYPFPSLDHDASAEEFFRVINDKKYDPTAFINAMSVGDQRAKFLLKKLLIQDQKNLSIDEIYKDPFFDEVNKVQRQYMDSAGAI